MAKPVTAIKKIGAKGWIFQAAAQLPSHKLNNPLPKPQVGQFNPVQCLMGHFKPTHEKKSFAGTNRKKLTSSP